MNRMQFDGVNAKTFERMLPEKKLSIGDNNTNYQIKPRF